MIRYIYMVWSEFFFGPDPPWWCLMWLGNSELLGPPFPPDSTVLAATNHAVDPAMTARMELPTSRLCWKRGWWVALAVSYDILSGAYSRFHGYDSGCGIFAYLHGVCIYIYVCVCDVHWFISVYIIYTVYIYIYILQFVVWYSSLQVKINHSVAEIIAAQHWKIHWISKSGTCNKLPL